MGYSFELTKKGCGIITIPGHREEKTVALSAHVDTLGPVSYTHLPVVAKECELEIEIMKEFFREQFSVNHTETAMKYWQVYDRTNNQEVPKEKWQFDSEKETVVIKEAVPFHTYTVSFLAYRIWEEISMYNHTTNHWDKEHLMQIDPRYPETREYMTKWMEDVYKRQRENSGAV